MCCAGCAAWVSASPSPVALLVGSASRWQWGQTSPPLDKLMEGSGGCGTAAVGWAEERSLGVVSFWGQRCQAVALRLSCVL